MAKKYLLPKRSQTDQILDIHYLSIGLRSGLQDLCVRIETGLDRPLPEEAWGDAIVHMQKICGRSLHGIADDIENQTIRPSARRLCYMIVAGRLTLDEVCKQTLDLFLERLNKPVCANYRQWAEASAIASDHGLPALTGSDKQCIHGLLIRNWVLFCKTPPVRKVDPDGAIISRLVSITDAGVWVELFGFFSFSTGRADGDTRTTRWRDGYVRNPTEIIDFIDKTIQIRQNVTAELTKLENEAELAAFETRHGLKSLRATSPKQKHHARLTRARKILEGVPADDVRRFESAAQFFWATGSLRSRTSTTNDERSRRVTREITSPDETVRR